ncbi:Zinc finger protein [Plakobranchus ocellatus]|uniref:Zinc finger protein n=1 Tax=Plakobranchus ocellatus TaxID=259542 RepID=A0AAV4AYD8_9GAST|nr:Zinc finger protein [Plakobranchus ocellatus]
MDRHYQFIKIPYGMMSSGATLTRAVKMMVRVLEYVVDYADDLLVHNPTLEDHMTTLGQHFMRLQRTNINVRPTKSVLEARRIDFLGHRLGEGPIGLQEKIETFHSQPISRSSLTPAEFVTKKRQSRKIDQLGRRS